MSTIRLIRFFFLFLKNTYGCISNPYITYRQLTKIDKDYWQIIYIYLLVFVYFLISSIIRLGFFNPYILTVKFNVLILSFLLGFFGVVFLIKISSFLIFKKNIVTRTLILLWSYTLLPTLLWFYITSFMYLILPPPRSTSFLGKAYSLVFLSFSMFAFFWKLILYYLTVRFSLKASLNMFITVTLFMTPFLAIYILTMYWFGIFKVPFI
jgi:hypothetical protein